MEKQRTTHVPYIAEDEPFPSEEEILTWMRRGGASDALVQKLYAEDPMAWAARYCVAKHGGVYISEGS